MIALSPRPRAGLMHNRQALLFGVVCFTLLLWTWHLFSGSNGGPRSFSNPLGNGKMTRYWTVTDKGRLEGLATWEKPASINKIVAIIFYGRPATVSILDCYLKRNLVKNGGMLDEVVWIMRTKTPEDIAWLDTLLTTEPAYSKWEIKFDDGDYRSAYDKIENGTMYIKIDDDIVFMEDSVIPSIVHTKHAHPEYYIVSANIMNQPSLSWVHYHLGAVRPYLPELETPAPSTDVPERLGVDWRASKLPIWSGPDDFEMNLEWKSAYPRHRWLPVSGDDKKRIDSTPIVQTAYDAFSKGLFHWQIAAQEHYSFFENLEKNELYKYKFHTWDYNYTRMGIQFVAMMGDDINEGKPMKEGDDEYYFTQIMPEKTKRHAIVDGRAIAAHYSFKPQRDGIASTDILERYKSYAKENICTSEMTFG